MTAMSSYILITYVILLLQLATVLKYTQNLPVVAMVQNVDMVKVVAPLAKYCRIFSTIIPILCNSSSGITS